MSDRADTLGAAARPARAAQAAPSGAQTAALVLPRRPVVLLSPSSPFVVGDGIFRGYAEGQIERSVSAEPAGGRDRHGALDDRGRLGDPAVPARLVRRRALTSNDLKVAGAREREDPRAPACP